MQDSYFGVTHSPTIATPTRIDRFRAPPRSASKGGICSIGSGIIASLGCGLSRDEAPEIEIDALHRQLDLDANPPPPEFSGDYQGEHGPRLPGIFSTSADQPLAGDVLRSGQVWMIAEEACDQDDEVERGELFLYANGVCFKPEKPPWGGNAASSSRSSVQALLQPFAFVRLASKQCAALHDAAPNAKIFAITLYMENRTLFFGVSGADEATATAACLRWVRDISLSIRWVTESLFSHGSCFQATAGPPAPREHNGAGRLMAGYLLHSEQHSEVVRLIFVELHPPRDGKAWMLLYDDADCSTTPSQKLAIDSRTACYEKVGHDCSCFCIGTLQFAARTVFERQLWLRAIANLKVKLQSRGQEPRPEDLAVWREAIKEHIHENAGKLRNRISAPVSGQDSSVNDSYDSTQIGSSSGGMLTHPWSDDEEAKRIFDPVQDPPLLRDLAEVAEKLRGLPLLQRSASPQRRPRAPDAEVSVAPWDLDSQSFLGSSTYT